MRRFRAFAVSLSLAAAGLMPVTVGQQAACAATADSAALVVDTGGSVTDYCVELGGGSVSGIDLIKLASQQYGMSYNLGFGGKAVCALNGIGVTDSGDCFASFPDYWGYWIGDGSGGWLWSSVGGDSVTVEAGDVQGWSYGSGKDGSTHPQPPATAYEDVCRVKDASGGSGSKDGGPKEAGGSGTGGSKDTAANQPGRTDHAAQDPAGTSGNSTNGNGSDGASGDGRPRDGEPTPAARATEAATAASFDPSAVVLAAPNGSGSRDGPPAAGFAVLLAVLVLGMAGAYMTRGRGARHRAGHTSPRV